MSVDCALQGRRCLKCFFAHGDSGIQRCHLLFIGFQRQLVEYCRSRLYRYRQCFPGFTRSKLQFLVAHSCGFLYQGTDNRCGATHILRSKIFHLEMVEKRPSPLQCSPSHLYSYTQTAFIRNIAIYRILIIVRSHAENLMRGRCPVTEPHAVNGRIACFKDLFTIARNVFRLRICQYMMELHGHIVSEKGSLHLVEFVSFRPPRRLPTLICRTRRVKPLHGYLICTFRKVCHFLTYLKIRTVPDLGYLVGMFEFSIPGLRPSGIVGSEIRIDKQSRHIGRPAISQ